MPLRLWALLLALSLLVGGDVHAQSGGPAGTAKGATNAKPAPAAPFEADGHVVMPEEQAKPPEIVTDLSRLPAPVAATRERLMAAARSGDLQKFAAVFKLRNPPTTFSFGDDKDPVSYWKENYPDSEGLEVLAILLTVLEAGFVHVDEGTPQDVYLWPYFARMPLGALTPEQKIELLRIATGADYKDMVEFGAYSFYRLGIAPDGSLQFFVSGD
jgi:hypothetical protein